MIPNDRFLLHEVQKQTILQPECPAYIHCSRLCTEKRSQANFLQVRMVNRWDRVISSVFLGILGRDRDGSVLFDIREMVLADCNALPHTVFGENRLLALGRKYPAELQITVERIVFADGLIWRRLPGQKLVRAEEIGWTACRCGMKNPPEAAECALCGRKLKAPANREETEPVPEEKPAERPAPIVRQFIPRPPLPEEEEGTSKGLVALLVILVILAVLAAGGFLYWCFTQNLL